jgi:hypothetical protein
MALFRNLGVNLRDRLCDVPRHASAQSLDFLDLAKNCLFLNWKLTLVPIDPYAIYGWALDYYKSHFGKHLGDSIARRVTVGACWQVPIHQRLYRLNTGVGFRFR